MKRIIFLILGVIVVALCVGYVRSASRHVGSIATAESPAAAPATDGTQKGTREPAPPPQNETAAAALTSNAANSTTSAPGASAKQESRQLTQTLHVTTDSAAVSRAVNTIISLDSSYADKQAAFRQLTEAGKLDEAIAALEQKHAAEPLVADYAATLGHAYLKKCGTTQDMREQAILAMQADKLFDTALNVDSSNWEARFTKAVAMSYWPANLNKGDEVIQHFQTLIQQQELETARPEFAETYLWLGDQLQKTGQHENAVAVWGRGASLFPTHDGLRNRLAGAQ